METTKRELEITMQDLESNLKTEKVPYKNYNKMTIRELVTINREKY